MTQRKSDSRDDSDLRDDLPTPSQSSSAGGSVATDVGSRDEERLARGGDPEPTRVTKQDKIQPKTATRADHHQASR